MYFSIPLVCLVTLRLLSTSNAAAINTEANANIAKGQIDVRDRLPLLNTANDIAEREAAPVTEAAASPSSPDAIFKRACYGACDGQGGPGYNTWATLVRIFKEEFNGGNFAISYGQRYCVSCSDAVLGFMWSGGYTYVSNSAIFEESISCGEPDSRACIFAGEHVGPYGGYFYGWNSDFHNGSNGCKRVC